MEAQEGQMVCASCFPGRGGDAWGNPTNSLHLKLIFTFLSLLSQWLYTHTLQLEMGLQHP